jgi:hypothetical protein
MTDKDRQSIDELIDNFDFEKVQAYMALTGWKYFDSENAPTIQQLKETARETLIPVAEKKSRWSMFGGFRADRYEDEGQTELVLMFVAIENSVYV